ncbi:MAG: hypothetical protein Q8902_02260 [Bacteroidota bacterium]|nr:hypothetical protein [Bacteroidota bacterium]
MLLALAAGCTTDVPIPRNQLEFNLSKGGSSIPDSLFPIFPNPFNRVTGDTTLHIRFALKDSGSAVVLVQNAIGDEITQYSDSALAPGIYATSWDPLSADGSRLNAGLYFITLHTQNYINSRLVNIEENE